MKNIFGDNMDYSIKSTISSIGYDEQKLICDILSLHSLNKIIDIDPTYSIGNFYKKGLSKPKYKFDKYPQLKEVQQASADNLPLEDESVNTIMFDPPFVIGGVVKDSGNIIAKRFMSFQSFEELKVMYHSSLLEFYRILKKDGIVIFKCQDVIVNSSNHFTHCWVMQDALKIGFYPKDLCILLAHNRIIGKMNTQQHVRKFHSYFWILKKEKCKINYNHKNQ